MRVPCFNLSMSLMGFCLIALVAQDMGCSGADLGAGGGTNRNIGSVGNTPVGGATGVGGNATGSSNPGGSTSVGGATGAATSTGGTQTASVPTWTQLYNNYFNSACTSCHSSQSPVFTTAASMCTVLKQYGHIGNGASLATLITWFNQGGYMPLDTSPAPANAVADITAWQNAGAVCP